MCDLGNIVLQNVLLLIICDLKSDCTKNALILCHYLKSINFVPTRELPKNFIVYILSTLCVFAALCFYCSFSGLFSAVPKEQLFPF